MGFAKKFMAASFGKISIVAFSLVFVAILSTAMMFISIPIHEAIHAIQVEQSGNTVVSASINYNGDSFGRIEWSGDASKQDKNTEVWALLGQFLFMAPTLCVGAVAFEDMWGNARYRCAREKVESEDAVCFFKETCVCN